MLSAQAEAAILLADAGCDITVAGLPARGLFDCAHAAALGFVSGSQPTLLLPEDAAFALDEGTSVVVFANDQTVRFSGTIVSAEADGTGWVMLRLSED